ncbi:MULTISPECIES: 4-hydroxyphenylpyruvate dioxygenase [unclassified Amycolatopsis]|uniref:4-hydroxyphenylpyruvate dioxygenase n=1 Tax=unclassified Amycolatopsis TaxID=2618356 RepID=UPI002E2088A5|nr:MULTISPECIES: 4-hydroxyphenylpyruvate dioxygenase [unclassified Amycolatopsis]
MATPNPSVLDGLELDYVRFYVGSLDTARNWLVRGYGLGERPLGDAGPDWAAVRSTEIGANDVRFVFSEPLVEDHPGTAYVDHHGDGVADIALRVSDATAAFEAAVARGARPVAGPSRAGGVVTASIMGFGDTLHTFVEYPDGPPAPITVDAEEPGALLEIDHFAVCVENGHLDATVDFYRDVLNFELIFDETLAIGAQAMTTKVVQSKSGSVTFTLIEPDTSKEPGHIDDFLKDHGGAGVQHIAFAANGIIEAVELLRDREVEFMGTPDSYYADLLQRVVPEQYSLADLRDQQVLVDEDHDGQLYQIFARSVHPRNTIFLELVERLGARGFGSGNITALYQAAERQRDHS